MSLPFFADKLLKTFGATPEAIANLESALARLEDPAIKDVVMKAVDACQDLPVQLDRIERQNAAIYQNQIKILALLDDHASAKVPQLKLVNGDDHV
jgi:cob(I)alamin adenosyltransferase